jgi:hypothetical protein
MKVVTRMTRSTASQLASDIRRIVLRDPESIRVTGFLPGERWDAVFDNDPADPNVDHFYVWIRLDNIHA